MTVTYTKIIFSRFVGQGDKNQKIILPRGFNLEPNILMETAFPLYFFPLISDGTAAGFLTLSSLSEGLSTIRQPVNYFQVYRKDVPLGHTIYSFQNKKRYEPAYLRRFKELARGCFEGIEKMRLSSVEAMD